MPFIFIAGLWGLIGFLLLCGWCVTTFKARRFLNRWKVGALAFGQVLPWVFLSTILIRYAVVTQALQKSAQAQQQVLNAAPNATGASGIAVASMTPYQFLFDPIVNNAAVQQQIPQIAQSLHILSLASISLLSLFIYLTALMFLSINNAKSWSLFKISKQLTPVVGFLGLICIYFLYSSTTTTILHASDIFDLYGMLPVLMYGSMLWLMGEHPIEKIEEQDEEIAEEENHHRDIFQHWNQKGVIEQELIHLDAVHDDNVDELSTQIWKSVGGNSLAPTGLHHIRNEIEKIVKTNPKDNLVSGMAANQTHAWMINSVPQPSESQLIAATAILGILKGLRPLIIIPNQPTLSGKAIPGQDLLDLVNQSLATFSGSWDIGRITIGKDDLNASLAEQIVPTCIILQADDLDHQLQNLWIADSKQGSRTHLLLPNIGMVLVSGFDSGTLQELTSRIFVLKRLSVALNVFSANFSILATTDSGKWSNILFSNAFNSVEPLEVPFGPKQQSHLSIWKADSNFVEKDIYSWPVRACENLEQADHKIYISDPLGIFSTATAHDWTQLTSLRRQLFLEGDGSIAMLDEQNFVKIWRQIQNRTAIFEHGHHSVWYWQNSIITNVFESPEKMKKLEDKGLLPYPRPAAGLENAFIVKREIKKLIYESRGLLDQKTLESLSILPAFIEEQIKELEQNNKSFEDKFILRKDYKTGQYRRVKLLAPLNLKRNEVFGLDSAKDDDELYIVKDVTGGGSDLFTAPKSNVKLRFYKGRVFAVGQQRYQVRQDFHAYDDKLQYVNVEKLGDFAYLTEPLLSVRVDNILHKTEDVKLFTIPELNHLEVRMANVIVTVTETIEGFRATDEHSKEVRYEPITGKYKTTARVIFFPSANSKSTKGKRPSWTAHRHLAELLDRVLMVYLNASDDDVHVCEFGFRRPEQGLEIVKEYGEGILFLDRNPTTPNGINAGMGVNRALDDNLLKQMIMFSRFIMAECPVNCEHGCEACSPSRLFTNEVLSQDSLASIIRTKNGILANKRGVLKMLEN